MHDFLSKSTKRKMSGQQRGKIHIKREKVGEVILSLTTFVWWNVFAHLLHPVFFFCFSSTFFAPSSLFFYLRGFLRFPFLISRLIFFASLALSYASFCINYMFQRVERTMLMDSIFEGNKLWIYYARSNYIFLSSWFCQDLKISALSNSRGVLRS